MDGKTLIPKGSLGSAEEFSSKEESHNNDNNIFALCFVLFCS